MAGDSGKQTSTADLPEFPSKNFVRGFRRSLRIFKWVVLLGLSIWLANLLRKIPLPDLQALYDESGDGLLWVNKSYWITGALGVLATVLLRQCFKSGTPVYLVDFMCYRPPKLMQGTRGKCREYAARSGAFDADSQDFQARIAERAGLGDCTFLPTIFHALYASEKPIEIDMHYAREEAELVMFGAMGNLLKKTGLKPKNIDILIVNCSLFNPTPSLTAMIVNHFKLRTDIITYNLSGMGCSAGVIAIGLARELLKVYPNKNAVVVSTENITQNWYQGKERSMLLPNILFKMGASAVFLTNKRSERHRAKYELLHVIRVHLGANDKAYRCVYQHPDSEGILGVELNKDLVGVASKALQHNLTRMGPLVLPWSEFVFLGINLFAAKILRMKVKAYVPDFKTAFDHFCLHAGGRAVIEGLSRQLDLPQEKTKPSFATLEWYGNTSSSTVWYSLGFIESCQNVRKGDIVWQVGFGSGFKCNSSVWRAMRDVRVTHFAWKHLVDKQPSEGGIGQSNAGAVAIS